MTEPNLIAWVGLEVFVVTVIVIGLSCAILICLQDISTKLDQLHRQ